MQAWDVVVLGGGGHGLVLLDALSLCHPDWRLAVLDPDPGLHGKRLLGFPVLGDDAALAELVRASPALRFVVGIGAISATPHRARLFALACSHGLTPITVLHPTAFVSPHATVEQGAQIMAGAVVSTQARVGANAIINTRAVVEHDGVVGRHAHVATGACLAGGVQVGEGALIGAGATVRQYLRVGARAVVGAGAVVVKPVPDDVTVVGVPAHALRART